MGHLPCFSLLSTAVLAERDVNFYFADRSGPHTYLVLCLYAPKKQEHPDEDVRQVYMVMCR